MTNRIYKFRAWDKEQKRMLDNVGFSPWQKENTGYTANEIYVGDKNPHFILMQFTGLLDKNGREIFEGDVLKRYGVHEPIHVYWKAPSFVSTGASGVGHWYFDDAEAVEIIGNIWENPELLA
jgi:uncharacterized phage protein (TIGR01671 family)